MSEMENAPIDDWMCMCTCVSLSAAKLFIESLAEPRRPPAVKLKRDNLTVLTVARASFLLQRTPPVSKPHPCIVQHVSLHRNPPKHCRARDQIRRFQIISPQSQVQWS